MTHFARLIGVRLTTIFIAGAFAGSAFATDIPKLTARANSGDPQAQFALGNAYMAGNGVDLNVAQGVIWCRLSADQGYAPAQSQLALKYASGNGVPMDKIEADKWVILATSSDSRNRRVKNLVEGLMTRDELRRGHVAAEQWGLDHPSDR